MLALTLWSENYDDYQLSQMAQELETEIKKVNDVSITHKIGGRNRQLRVVLDKDKLASSGLDFLTVSEMIKANNSQLNSGSFAKNDQEFLVNTGKFLESVTDVENLVIQEYRLLLFGIVVILILRFRPSGLMPRGLRQYFPGSST